MILTIIEYGGEKQQIECESFEFRCNQVTNWIRIKKADGEELIHNVCVVKTQAESEDKCKNCEYYRNPDYTRCHKCEAGKERMNDL